MAKRKPMCSCGLPFPHTERLCLDAAEQAALKRSKRGRGSKRKGGSGEREVIELLQPIVDTAYQAHGLQPPKLKRTSSLQADGGGCDVHGIDWLALEVKRCETLALDSWWSQCLRQAKPGQMPVLVYRQNGRRWRARLYVMTATPRVTFVVDIDVSDLLAYLEACLHVYISQGKTP